jgi:glycosyltransferase involved in cell wall biosynthesis
MVKISVIIITFNEEKNIERCLLSVKDIADEIIIVDSFSTDRTEEIAAHFNVRFIKNKFEGHIQQKNVALDLTSYNYVLSLDADEELSQKLRSEILKIKENWKYDAYCFIRRTRFYNKWIRFGDWYPDRKLRLWDKTKGRWGGINPHDRVIMNTRTSKCKVKGYLLHYYYNDTTEHAEQLNYFATIAAREYYHMGRKASLITILVHSGWRFFRAYFLKGGFLDGSVGYIVARYYSFYTFLKYTKLRQHLRDNNKK